MFKFLEICVTWFGNLCLTSLYNVFKLLQKLIIVSFSCSVCQHWYLWQEFYGAFIMYCLYQQPPFVVLAEFQQTVFHLFTGNWLDLFYFFDISQCILCLKACVCYFLSNFYFSPNYSPSKTMQNVFYFI